MAAAFLRTKLTDCPVEALGREMAIRVNEHLSADEACVANQQGNAVESVRHENAMKAAQARIDVLEEAASHVLATSLPGALFQVMLARSSVEALHSWIDEKNREAKSEADDLLAYIQRCLTSAMRVLESASGVSRLELGGRYFGPERYDHLSGLPIPTPSTPATRVEQLSVITQSAEERLLALNLQYERWNALYYDACDQIDAATAEKDEIAKEEAETRIAHAVRMCRQALLLSSGVVTVSRFGLALKSRLIAAELSEWWDRLDIEDGEAAARSLLDQLMSAGGVSRIEKRDHTINEIRSYRSNKRDQVAA
jgi:hypothetical protein